MNSSPPLPPELERHRALLSPEASAILGVKPATLANWRSARKGPAYILVGRSVRYELAALLAWRDQGRVDPEAGR